MKKENCPLCNCIDIIEFSKDKKREYYTCKKCNTIFVPEVYHLTRDQEKTRYTQHTNSENDPYYIKFLSRIIEPVLNYIPEGSEGLDFGCGPGPVLKNEFIKHKIDLKEYDLYFKDDRTLLHREWDFIITTEVVEHLKKPFNTIKRLWAQIKSDGVLGIMTCRYSESVNFSSWYYKGDPTHITYFTEDSFRYIANKLGAQIEFFDKDITILIKS